MARQLPQRIRSGKNQKSSVDEKPSGGSNSHFTDQDEEEAECAGAVAMATRLATTLICRLGPEN